jgi:branched-subunit amino acid ABC-type transport system permease component
VGAIVGVSVVGIEKGRMDAVGTVSGEGVSSIGGKLRREKDPVGTPIGGELCEVAPTGGNSHFGRAFVGALTGGGVSDATPPTMATNITTTLLMRIICLELFSKKTKYVENFK